MVGFINQYELLFSKAKADFFAASILYDLFCKGNSELDLEVICFHLQQCAEKLMKAVLSKKKIYFPRIHDLETLLMLINNNNIGFNPDRDLLIELNDYAVEGRYAVIHDDLDDIPAIFILIEDMMKEVNSIIYKE
jgi:HEPN domain-containing protein